ncbi:MAG: RNA polymerase sigma-70 factor (ECF subfamily) [Planctomycetota bacterium]|jgi:RNA polymerase sigma-70 factor (ECF subfamily)
MWPRRSRSALSILPSPSTTEDETLARAAASGSRAAFARLVDRYAGRVVSTLERRLGDHNAALDVGQETWIRVFRALPSFDADKSFRSWLFAIALNAARDEGRRRKRSPIDYVDELPHSASDNRAHDDRQAIDRALAGIAEPYRTAVVLIDSEGLDYQEAAASCDCALGTMKSRVARGRAAFREQWRKVCGETETTKRKSQ